MILWSYQAEKAKMSEPTGTLVDQEAWEPEQNQFSSLVEAVRDFLKTCGAVKGDDMVVEKSGQIAWLGKDGTVQRAMFSRVMVKVEPAEEATVRKALEEA